MHIGKILSNDQGDLGRGGAFNKIPSTRTGEAGDGVFFPLAAKTKKPLSTIKET